ncbi:MAG: ABC transporter permease subunit [Treponema sp.]|jgi:putative aldouronate transport system permease protein|nr:ABC transporter permease subunit [Treponema sp.]
MKKKVSIAASFRQNWQLYVLTAPALVWLAVFAYAPLYGLVIAFKDFKPRAGILASPWARPLFKHFAEFFSTNMAWTTISNTLILSLETLVFSFPIPIIFALLLNQIRTRRLRKAIQTLSYAPFFISTVVVVSILTVVLSPGSGFVNVLYQKLSGGAPALFMSRPEYFRPVYIISGIWQSMGFNAIIYIAALAGVSPDLYEAAIVDGATKFQRILHIDIPSILPTAMIMFVLALGGLMSVGYEKVFLMQRGMNTVVSEVISTYVYKTGLQSAQYSFATAVGLFNSLVNFVILVTCNWVTKKTSDVSIF